MKLLNKVEQGLSYFIKSYFLDESSKRFIKHNKKIWDTFKETRNNKSEILFEFNGLHSAIIAYSYSANILAEKHQAKIVAFAGPSEIVWKTALKKLFEPGLKKIYKSFNVSQFLDISLNKKQKHEVSSLFKKIYPQIKTKSDVELLMIEGIWIGDLLYDTYLRSKSVPTIDLQKKDFIVSFKKSLKHYIFWRDYFNTHDVKALNVSHCVYNLAIPLRIAIARNIPGFQINATSVALLTEKNFFAYNDFKNFPKQFKALPKDIQTRGLSEAKVRLERRFAGEVGVDMAYSTKSAYTAIKKERVIRKSKRIKIFIAAHCFFDSPHAYGLNLFPDFYEWLSFLGEISKHTDYDWYIKTHPDSLPGNKEIIEYFLKKYPRFTLISADTSHKQIIQEGINFALTVYGTIGFEYAALGIPVINASLVNPHIAYNFNIHPKTVDEYKNILMNLDKQELSVDLNQVYEYYYMKFIYNTSDWLFDNYSNMKKELGGYKEQFTSRVYDYFLNELSDKKHERIMQTLNNYVESGDFRLNYDHM